MTAKADFAFFAQTVFERVKECQEGVAYILITPDCQCTGFHPFDDDGQIPVDMADGLVGSFVRDLMHAEILQGHEKRQLDVEEGGE